MVAHRDGIVAHVGGKAWIDMRRECVHIVEIVRGVVSLKAVSGVNQKHIVGSIRRTYTVHDSLDCIERLLHSPADVGGIKIGSVHVIGRQKLEHIVSVLESRTASRQQKSGGSGDNDRLEYYFHTL